MTAHAERTEHPPYVEVAGLYAVPSLHGRQRFAQLVRQAFLAVGPEVIAVELPATLESSMRQAVARLPYLSVVAYEDFDAELDQVTRYIPVTPADSLVEALRLGSEHGVPVHFIDRDVVGYEPPRVPTPDEELIGRFGLEWYWRQVAGQIPAPEAEDAPDRLREADMAAALRDLTARHRRVLLVCGLAHLEGIAAHLRAGTAPQPGAVTRREQRLYNLAAESMPQAFTDLPYVAYAYELARHDLHPQEHPQLLPPPVTKGPEHTAAVEAYDDAAEQLLPLLRQTSRGSGRLETYPLLTDMVRAAVRLYEREWNEQPAPVRLHTLLRFARNMALVKGRLAPQRYHLVLASKNTVNDDFAFQTLRLIDHYPFFEQDSELPELKMEGEAGEAEGEMLVLRPRFSRRLEQDDGEGAGEPVELPEPAEEAHDGSWQERWEVGDHHVSHLPQDQRLERFFEYIRNKCRRLISEQNTRTHEMQASLMDGLDLRETLRNLPRGKLYVKEELPGVGDVGPVVVIFHRPGEEHHYPHERMWYAEHEGESDLALYATEPGVQLDGPGISRCQYGGVLSLYPPTGRVSVWDNPRYAGTRDRAELLLKAAVDLSRKPIVAYVAPQGPPNEMLSFAASRGVHILYVPLDTLSAETLRRVRTFHVLADREVRLLAHLYIN